MESTFLTFKKFNDLTIAETIGEKLKENGINYIIENERNYFDPAFANNAFASNILLKIRSTDFTKAHIILEENYKTELKNIDKDYYLLSFTDEELIEIICKPDEWGYFDYQLALKLLKERGKEVNLEVITLLKSQRMKELSKPETTHRHWVYLGYISSILGGLLGLFIGWHLSYFKKTLPNGERIYAYTETERNHGTRMLLISCASLIFCLFIRLYLFN